MDALNMKTKETKLSADIWGKVLNSFLEFLKSFGIFSMVIARTVCIGFSQFYRVVLSRQLHRLDWIFHGIGVGFKKIGHAIKARLFLFLKFFLDANQVIRNGYRKEAEASFIVRCFHASRAFSKGVWNNRKIFFTSLNYAVPVAAFFGLLTIISYGVKLNFAVSVEYNGEHLGYIADESVFERAEDKLQERMIYLESDEVINNLPQFSLAVVDEDTLITETQVTDSIIKQSSGDIAQATGLLIDGEFLGAVKDGRQLSDTLNSLLDNNRTGSDEEEVSFVRNVQTETGIYMAKNIVDEEALVEKLTGRESMDVYYEVKAGDTPIMIAAGNEIELDELVALNPDILTNCPIGKQVLLNKSRPFLPVKVVKEEASTEEIPFKTEYVDTDTLYKGSTKVNQEGANGEQIVTSEVEYVDGVEAGRTILSTVVTESPVVKIVARGTKPVPVSKPSSNTGSNQIITGGKVSGYGLIWPVSGGYISQYYRGSAHDAIDYAFRGNGYGQPIRAALSGTIVTAGWSGSFGNLVVVQSSIGIQTWDAHCSKINVRVGQTVSQGEVISLVGSTGRSTGNHLHFRVIVNGVPQNPLNFLP